jgi:hypothetical protein
LSTNNGVFLSIDSGQNWQGMNEGLPALVNQVRDNVAENLAITADHKSLILGLVDYGFWKADISGLDFGCASFASDNADTNENPIQGAPAGSRRSYTWIYIALASTAALIGVAAVVVLAFKRRGRSPSDTSLPGDMHG